MSEGWQEKRRKMHAFSETELGKLFNRFDSAHSLAWVKDTEAGFRDGWPGKSVDKAWEREREAREALLAKLYEIAGVE